MARRPELNRHERRVLSRRRHFVEWVRDNPQDFLRLVREQWPLLFGKELLERGDFRRYILGEVPRDEANKALRFYITDPVTVYEVWFETYKWNNPVPERRDKMADKLVETLKTFEAMLDGEASLSAEIRTALAATGANELPEADREALVKLKRDAKSFRSEIISPEELSKHPAWIKLVGEAGALIASQIFYGRQREKREIKRSDAIDMRFTRCIYRTPTFGGATKRLATCLSRNRCEKFHERVVPRSRGASR